MAKLPCDSTSCSLSVHACLQVNWKEVLIGRELAYCNRNTNLKKLHQRGPLGKRCFKSNHYGVSIESIFDIASNRLLNTILNTCVYVVTKGSTCMRCVLLCCLL